MPEESVPMMNPVQKSSTTESLERDRSLPVRMLSSERVLETKTIFHPLTSAIKLFMATIVRKLVLRKIRASV